MSDLISRHAAIKAIDDLPNCYNGYSDTYDKAYIICVLEDVPSVEPKHGKWIEEPNCWYRCSNCGEHYPSLRGYMDYNYCPNCGALMERSEE